MSKLQLTVVSQERQLLQEQVDSVTAPASDGEVTILPEHISLVTTLDPGELIYRSNGNESSIVVSNGFLTVGGNNQVIVMVDSAVHAREISLKKSQEAIEAAKSAITFSKNRQELLMAEANLKQALLEVRVAERSARVRG
ncbi:ATPase, F1 complex, delta/epsilon subunit [sediment metagenome]|uniref:ATPase, F1 complex, delta/epsilon subunit n=1 Tax=sediment metagenome TaxID=749907 RepID=D9PHX1_9ZZZZ